MYQVAAGTNRPGKKIAISSHAIDEDGLSCYIGRADDDRYPDTP